MKALLTRMTDLWAHHRAACWVGGGLLLALAALALRACC
jgi:hypothetical protein